MLDQKKISDWRAEVDEFFPKVTPFISAVFCVFVFIWFVQIGERRPFFATIRFEAVLAAILLGMSALSLLGHGNSSKRSTYLFPYVLTFFVVLLIHVNFSRDPEFSWNIFWNRIVKFSCMGLFIAMFVKSPRHLRYFVIAFLLGCAFVVQESFGNAMDGSMVWYNQGIPRLHGNTSLFAHPNSLAGLAMGTIPFIWFLVPAVRSNFTRIALIALGVMAVAVVMYCGSRTSYVGFIFFAAFAFYASRRRIGFALFLAIVASVGIHYMPEEYQARFLTIFTGEEIEGGSMQARTEILEDAWRIFKEYPFGVGVGAFVKVRMEMFSRWQDTHNLYLEVATNIGIHGFIIFMLLVHKIFRVYRVARVSFENQTDRLMAYIKKSKIKEEDQPLLFKHLKELDFLRAMTWSAGGYVFIRLVLGLFGMDLYEIYWWIAIGLASSLFTISEGTEKITEKMLSVSTPTREIEVDKKRNPVLLSPRSFARGRS